MADNTREESILSKLDFLNVEDSLKVEKLIQSEITKSNLQLLDELEEDLALPPDCSSNCDLMQTDPNHWHHVTRKLIEAKRKEIKEK